MITEQRQRVLREQYNFSCTCEACKNPSPIEKGLVHLKCEKCGGPQRLQEALESGVCSLFYLQSGDGICSK